MEYKKVLKKIFKNKILSPSILDEKVIEVDNLTELKKLFRWDKNPILEDSFIFDFDYEEDLNERRIRDAEVLGCICINSDPKVILEIGTSKGKGTAHISRNSKNSKIYTVNIPPDNYSDRESGIFKTHKLEVNEIGEYYRNLGFTNIQQIYANTRNWNPKIGKIDIAFIDGCHDREFVINDSIKVIKNSNPGSFILWHDFNPSLRLKYKWINQVMLGIEDLYDMKFLNGKIYHVKNSWIGIYRVK
jgi:predicted O-methyltransferase YrrM